MAIPRSRRATFSGLSALVVALATGCQPSNLSSGAYTFEVMAGWSAGLAISP